ncbi:AAA family ATPase [Faecalibaculum rodentium]|uniref:AAA family ATPase n=1 Tax=Faecalibaculum rodentium TaxID=1702221 RepID=UPI0023EFEA67|nr:ATP-binding protein [Faecalibaculum rodentium]
MKVKSIQLNHFKRFTHLTINNIPKTARLILMVGPNGCGKTSVMEAINHYYRLAAFANPGKPDYILKSKGSDINKDNWYYEAQNLVNIDFYDADLPKGINNDLEVRKRFYFRSAYRNEPDFEISSMSRQDDPTENIRLQSFIQNDLTVSNNYQRLVSSTISSVYNPDNDSKYVSDLREELTGQINTALENVFEDLTLSSIGDPLKNGNFYFTKGTAKDFSYCNLSAGEKSAFDLILDIVIQSKYYPNAIYCIDEPETHMHTKLQGNVLNELFSLTPEQSQLWLSIHSIGMLRAAQDLDRKNPGSVVFLDFDGIDFDTDAVIQPSKLDKGLLDKFYELMFGDFSKLMLPEKIVVCEGTSQGKKRKDFDKAIYSTIFQNTHPEAFFLSGGACNDIENFEESHSALLQTILGKSQIIKVIDRDDHSNQEVQDFEAKGIKVLTRRNLESYLLDDDVIEKLCNVKGQPDKFEIYLKEKNSALEDSVSRGNPTDDLKSARGYIYNSLKRLLNLTQCGNNSDFFIRDTLAPLITPDMQIYKELEGELFGPLINQPN